jgi:hypothetical protein
VLDADDGYSETSTVRIADGEGDQIEGLTQLHRALHGGRR